MGIESGFPNRLVVDLRLGRGARLCAPTGCIRLIDTIPCLGVVLYAPFKLEVEGNQKLAKLRQTMKVKKASPGQKSLWENWNLPIDEVEEIAKKFVLANCFKPENAVLQFTDLTLATGAR